MLEANLYRYFVYHIYVNRKCQHTCTKVISCHSWSPSKLWYRETESLVGNEQEQLTFKIKKKPFNIDICTHPDDKSDINIRFYDTWIQTIISRLFRRICVQQFWRRTRVFPHMAMCNKRSKVLLDHMNFQLFDHLFSSAEDYRGCY